jgi:hypothetical protein
MRRETFSDTRNLIHLAFHGTGRLFGLILVVLIVMPTFCVLTWEIMVEWQKSSYHNMWYFYGELSKY